MHWPPGPDPLTNVSTNSSSFSTIFCLTSGGVGLFVVNALANSIGMFRCRRTVKLKIFDMM